MSIFLNEEWAARGLCVGMDPDEAEHVFFNDNTQEAKKICQHCPVAAACLTWAVANKERGIWAGTNEDDRGRIRAMHPNGPTQAVVTKYTTPKPPPPCGTVPGYNHHRAEGETTCQPCRDAIAANRRAQRKTA